MTASRLRALVIVLALLFLQPVALQQSDAASRPNILIIVTDDQRLDQMAGMARTNALFKDGGITYTNAYAATPLCCPSRATIFSGRYPHNHGVKGNTIPDVDHLDLGRTMQKALKASGYQTGIAGKIFNGWDIARNPPDFDRWAIMRGGYQNTTFNVNGTLRSDTGYSTDFVSNQAKSMLDQFQAPQNATKPWFLYVAPFAAHFPYTPALIDTNAVVGSMPDHQALRETDKRDKPPWIANYTPTNLGLTPAQVWQAQSRSLLQVDRLVQRLFANQQNPRDTLAIFVSDNGYLLGEHGIAEDKRLPYPESVRVPLLVRWPARLSGHTVDNRLAMNVDITATVAAAAGLPTTYLPVLDGRNLLGSYKRSEVYLEGFASKENPGDPGFPAWSSIIKDGFQYTEWYGPAGRLAFQELYNSATDPQQLLNLFYLAPRAANTFAKPFWTELTRLRTCSGTVGPQACP